MKFVDKIIYLCQQRRKGGATNYRRLEDAEGVGGCSGCGSVINIHFSPEMLSDLTIV